MKLAIFGASGFSREAADVALVSGYTDILFIEPNPAETVVHGFLVQDESVVESLAGGDWSFLIGVGDNNVRRKIFEKFPALRYTNVFHPSASFGHRQLEQFERTRGNIVTAGVRFTNNIAVGSFGIYNLNCTVGHDCILEDFVNVAPGVNISGNVHVREGAYLGTNCTIIQGKAIDAKLVIGRGSTVGAGSVVTKEVPDGVIVKGVPAK